MSADGQKSEIQCVWGHLCTLSSVDQARNNLSLYNLIEEISLPSEIFKKFEQDNKAIAGLPHEIIILWRRILSLNVSDEELSADIKVALIDPKNKILQEITAPLKFGKGKRRMRTIIRNDGIKLSTPGDYIFKVFLKEQSDGDFKEVLQIPLEVKEK